MPGDQCLLDLGPGQVVIHLRPVLMGFTKDDPIGADDRHPCLQRSGPASGQFVQGRGVRPALKQRNDAVGQQPGVGQQLCLQVSQAHLSHLV